MKFFISEIIPPPPLFAFLKFFQKFMTKIIVSNANKFAMKFFRSEMTPPPPQKKKKKP